MSRVVHFEVLADDPARAVEFYQNVFGWEATKWDGPEDYWLTTTGADRRRALLHQLALNVQFQLVLAVQERIA